MAASSVRILSRAGDGAGARATNDARDQRTLHDDGFDATVVHSVPALLFDVIRRRAAAVQLSYPPASSVVLAVLFRVLGARVVLRVVEPWPERIAAGTPRAHAPTRVVLARAVRRVAMAACHRAIVPHRDVREACTRDGADVNKIAVVVDVPDAPPLDPDFHAARRDEIATVRRDERRRGEFRVVYRGGASSGVLPGTPDRPDARGLDVLVRAVHAVLADVPGMRVRLLGARDGAVEAALALAGELGVGARVEHAGDPPLEEAAVEMLEADVVVEPARETPWSALVMPASVFECALLRRPLVASRLGSITSYFDEDAVVTFAPGDAADLARALRRVFAHPEETPARVAAAARVADTHRWEREGRKYAGVYRALLAATAGRG